MRCLSHGDYGLTNWIFCPACGKRLLDSKPYSYDSSLPIHVDPIKHISNSLGNHHYSIHPFGYLEEIRIKLHTPMANMDAGKPYSFWFTADHPLNQAMFKLESICRSVRSY